MADHGHLKLLDLLIDGKDRLIGGIPVVGNHLHAAQPVVVHAAIHFLHRAGQSGLDPGEADDGVRKFAGDVAHPSVGVFHRHACPRVPVALGEVGGEENRAVQAGFVNPLSYLPYRLLSRGVPVTIDDHGVVPFM